MPIRQLDRAAIRREARELIRTARVSPIKFTLLFLAVSLALSLLDTALTSLTGRIVGVAFVVRFLRQHPHRPHYAGARRGL